MASRAELSSNDVSVKYMRSAYTKMMSKTPVRLGNFSDKRASNYRSIVITEFRFASSDIYYPTQNIIQLFLDDTHCNNLFLLHKYYYRYNIDCIVNIHM